MKRKCIDLYSGPFTIGIDVSKYQGAIDWQRVAASGCRYAFVRTGDGKSEDATAVRNLQGAQQAGLLVGTYHYFRADRDGATQAALARHIVEKSGVVLDLPPTLDLESGASKDLPGGIADAPGEDLPLELVADEAIEMLKDYRTRFGMRPIVYTGVSMHWWYSQARPAQAARFKEYPLWLPSYSKCARMPVDRAGNGFPWKQWTFWQFTGKGTIDGVPTTVDVNRFHGDLEALRAFARDSIVCG